MQTIWSRIAQVRGGCRCPHCIPSTSGVTRRAGTTAANGAPRYLTSSTLWYSGIFAAAATLDAGRKVQRREKWDSAIAEVKHELEGEGKAELGVLKEETSQQGAREKYEMLAKATTGYLEDHDLLAGNEVRDCRAPEWPVNTGPPLQRHNLAPESIFASPRRQSLNEHRSWSPKKVEIIGISIDLLQLRTLLTLHNKGCWDQALAMLPQDYAQQLGKPGAGTVLRIQELQADLKAVWKCSPSLEGYRRSDTRLRLNSLGGIHGRDRAHTPPADLDRTLQTMFRRHKRYRISTVELLANMSYALSQTTSPPNLDTYNALLLGMAHVDLPEVSRHIITSLTLSQLRPNEITICAILDNYTKHDDSAGFLRYVEKMRGKHNGLSLARPDIKITDAGRSRLKPKEGEPDKIIQLPYPTPKVMSSLISGLLHFAGFDTALGLCKSFSEEGWGICMSGLSSLMRDCAARNDWAAGSGVWEQIKALHATSRAQRRDASERIPLNAWAAMLRLCLGTGEREAYDKVWREAVVDHGLQAQKLGGLVRSDMKRAENQAEPERGMLEVRGQAAEPANSRSLGTNAARESAPDVSAAPDALQDQQAFHQAGQASAMLDELSGGATRASSPWGQPTVTDLPPKLQVMDAASIRRRDGASKPGRPTAPVEPLYTISLEQLHGTIPAGLDLDEYELAERPMEMRA